MLFTTVPVTVTVGVGILLVLVCEMSNVDCGKVTVDLIVVNFSKVEVLVVAGGTMVKTWLTVSKLVRVRVETGRTSVERTVLTDVIVDKKVSAGSVEVLVARIVRVMREEKVIPGRVLVSVLTVVKRVETSVLVTPLRERVDIDVPWRLITMVEVTTGKVVAFATVLTEDMVDVKIAPGIMVVLRMKDVMTCVIVSLEPNTVVVVGTVVSERIVLVD